MYHKCKECIIFDVVSYFIQKSVEWAEKIALEYQWNDDLEVRTIDESKSQLVD